jgi:hypothetical protein
VTDASRWEAFKVSDGPRDSSLTSGPSGFVDAAESAARLMAAYRTASERLSRMLASFGRRP